MENQKKILFIITKSVWGGAQKYVFDLASNLAKEEFEVSVAAGGKGILAEKIREVNISYFEIKNFQRNVNFFKDILAFFEILNLLRKIKPDIIHVSSSKAGGLTGLASWSYKLLNPKKPKPRKLKSCFTVHGWGFNEPRPRWQLWLIKLTSKLTAKFYQKIICVSEFDRQTAIKNKIAKQEKLINIHNGLETDSSQFLSRREAQQKLLGETNSYVIGAIAEWTKNKGLKYLIEVMPKIIKECPGVKFILIGWGEEISNLKSQISNLNLKNNVFLIENLNPAGPYLKAFDIFVLPSLKEGLPYTLLEAGLAEIPVVATSVGGIPEIIENEKTGILVKPANAEELKNAIEKLINEPELAQKLAFNLHQKILSEFSLEKMLKKTISLYARLIELQKN